MHKLYSLSCFVGTSSVSTRTQKKRKRKRRRRKRKTRSKENVSQDARYLLPREMDPTATFSLFGSDYDLEYLPVIETPVVASKQASPPRSVNSHFIVQCMLCALLLLSI